ncbi:MAG: glycosyl hydrolase [Burkholderiales bacterium]|nr:glycosyl hydrolase [Burkholderiales bacterium]
MKNANIPRHVHSLLLIAMLVPACSTGGETLAAGTTLSGRGPLVEAWVTTGDKTRLLAHEEGSSFGTGTALDLNIEVDDRVRYQTMVGFGASLTDASAWLIQNRMSEGQRNALMQELYGHSGNGVGFNFARLAIGSSDFSRSHYSFDDRPSGESDMTLTHFSIEPNRADVLPVIKHALAVNSDLQIMASPWSAPAWMKSSGSLIKGTLKQDMYGVFSDYLVRYVEAYAAEGIPIFALTVQNEPHFEPDDYPGMRLDPAMRARLDGQFLGPRLTQRGLTTQIIEWDHNWDEPSSPMAVLSDPEASRYVSGVGWHCYASEALLSNQSVVHQAYPGKDVWATECSGGEWKPNWSETLPWMVRNIVIGSTRHWARGVLMWNLALDESHGPHLGGCRDCRGVVTINSQTGAVTRNLEYYALAHASKFVRPGAQRIDSSTTSSDLQTVAFRNADDGSIVLIVCNSESSQRVFTTRNGGKVFEYTLPRESVATFVWKPDEVLHSER